MIKPNDIVTHKRRGTYGVVGTIDAEGITVLWHLGKGEVIKYKHSLNTKVISVFLPWVNYQEYYEKDRATLAVYFGVEWSRLQSRADILADYLGRMSHKFASKEGPLGDVESVAHGCDCLTRETIDIMNVVSGKTLKDMQREQGPAQGALSFRSRCTGKTTGIAFAVVGAALQHPATEIPYVDHHDSVTAREHLYHTICMLIDKLGLKGLDVNKQKRTVIFHPFVEVRTTYEAKTVITPVR